MLWSCKQILYTYGEVVERIGSNTDTKLGSGWNREGNKRGGKSEKWENQDFCIFQPQSPASQVLWQQRRLCDALTSISHPGVQKPKPSPWILILPVQISLLFLLLLWNLKKHCGASPPCPLPPPAPSKFQSLHPQVTALNPQNLHPSCLAFPTHWMVAPCLIPSGSGR